MKTIMLLRHAKSARDGSRRKDFDRPLAKRGQKDAPRIGAFARSVGVIPASIICSPAKRAEQTAKLFAEGAGIDSALIRWDKDLYYGGARDYLSTIQKSPEGAADMLLVGHNPLIEETVSLLCNEEGSYAVRMPAGALVCIEHPAMEWHQVKAGTARLRWMMIPKLLQKWEG